MNKEQLDGDRIFVIRGFLTEEECASFIAKSEQTGYREAAIRTLDGDVIAKEYRDNERVLVDDESLATELWQRARDYLPASVKQWRAIGLNVHG